MTLFVHEMNPTNAPCKIKKKWWSKTHLGWVNIENQTPKCVFIKFENYEWTW